MLHSAQEVYNYSGIYISYSLSSSSNALKVEPYLITPADSFDLQLTEKGEMYEYSVGRRHLQPDE